MCIFYFDRHLRNVTAGGPSMAVSMSTLCVVLIVHFVSPRIRV